MNAPLLSCKGWNVVQNHSTSHWCTDIAGGSRGWLCRVPTPHHLPPPHPPGPGSPETQRRLSQQREKGATASLSCGPCYLRPRSQAGSRWQQRGTKALTAHAFSAQCHRGGQCTRAIRTAPAHTSITALISCRQWYRHANFTETAQQSQASRPMSWTLPEPLTWSHRASITGKCHCVHITQA